MEQVIVFESNDSDRTRGIKKNSVVLVSCVKSKQSKKCSAEDMYISALFQKMMVCAKQSQPKKILILSAKYGLLRLDDLIEPYELSLKFMKVRERREWADQVIDELDTHANLSTDHFVFLAGKPYREYLEPHLGRSSTPMEGLPFGKQLQWLSEQVR